MKSSQSKLSHCSAKLGRIHPVYFATSSATGYANSCCHDPYPETTKDHVIRSPLVFKKLNKVPTSSIKNIQ